MELEGLEEPSIKQVSEIPQDNVPVDDLADLQARLDGIQWRAMGERGGRGSELAPGENQERMAKWG